jgi:hypothetical protein
MLMEMVKDAGIDVYEHAVPFRLDDGSVVLQTGVVESKPGSAEHAERDELVDMINQNAKDSAMATTAADDVAGEIRVAADSLVFAGRLLPRNSLVQELADSHCRSQVLTAGDCVRVDSIMNAVWGGFTAVREIAA